MVGGPVLNALPNNPIAIADNLLQFADVPPTRLPGRVKHIPGCNISIRKDVFLKAGEFVLSSSGEDVILTESVNQVFPRGIFFNPAMKIAHLGRNTLEQYVKHQKGFG